MKVYAVNEKIDPCLNPFVGQQLILDDAVVERPQVAKIPEPEPLGKIELPDV
jgi:hypothetical protein